MEEEKHKQWLIDQYNRNRAFKDQVKDFAEYNRIMLDLETRAVKEERARVTWDSWIKDLVDEPEEVQNPDDEDCTAYED
jgi:hypothetical protein